MSINADDVVAIAKQHRGQYLISRAEWHDKQSAAYRACASLVHAGRARWLDIKTSASEGLGESGPGIRLIGRDASEVIPE